MPIDPDDLERYGIVPGSFVSTSSEALGEFVEDHPEWAPIAGRGLSWEGSIMAWASGAPPPDEWAGISIMGRDDGSQDGDWTVEIVTADGEIHTLDIGYQYDYAWDFYDAAAWYGFDIEKDIDTGGPE